MLKKMIVIFAFLPALAGCAPQGVMSLKRLANSHAELQEELNTQEKFFSLLADDVKNNRLKEGSVKEDILSKYGEPIFTRDVNGGTVRKEVMLYRHPTKYFSSDLIYLYFNKEQRLCGWEIKPTEGEGK